MRKIYNVFRDGDRVMINFWLGFFMSLSFCLVAHITWEHRRHIPLVIRMVPVPVPMRQGPYVQPEPALDTYNDIKWNQLDQ